jgi:hypothetical protein
MEECIPPPPNPLALFINTADSNLKKKKTPVTWSALEETVLVNLLIEHHQRGNSSESGFKSIVFTEIATKLRETPPEQGPEKDADSCRNKYNNLKGDWKIVNKMVQQSGWGWDRETGRVTAPKMVFDDYVKSHPKAAPFRKKAFIHYEKLSEIFAGVIADGRGAFRPGITTDESQPPSVTVSTSISQANSRPSTPAANRLDFETLDSRLGVDEDDETSNTRNKRSTASVALDADPTGRDKKKRMRRSTAGGIEQLASSIMALTESVRSENSEENSEGTRFERAIHLLEKDIKSSKACAAAVSVVTQSNVMVNTYLGFRKKQIRMEWLKMQLEISAKEKKKKVGEEKDNEEEEENNEEEEDNENSEDNDEDA